MTLTKPLNLLFLPRPGFGYLSLSGLFFTFLLLLSTDINAANYTNETDKILIEHYTSIRASGGFSDAWILHPVPAVFVHEAVLVKKIQCTFANVM